MLINHTSRIIYRVNNFILRSLWSWSKDVNVGFPLTDIYGFLVRNCQLIRVIRSGWFIDAIFIRTVSCISSQIDILKVF